MKKIMICLLVLAAVLPFGSCRRAIEKARENIRVEEVEKIERHGMTGIDIVVRVKNDTGYKLALDQAQLDLYYGGREVGSVTLREGVGVDRRSTASVATQWKIRISDPLAMYVLAKKIEQGDLSQVAVSYRVKGKGGPAGIDISRDMVPVSEFLNTFGVTLEDVGNYLKN